jgi:hypothetical protein
VIVEVKPPEHEKLTTGTKNLINSISMDIIQSWPPFSDGVEADSKNVLVLVNAYAFVTQVFNIRLQMVVNKDVGEGKEVSKCSSYCIGNFSSLPRLLSR